MIHLLKWGRRDAYEPVSREKAVERVSYTIDHFLRYRQANEFVALKKEYLNMTLVEKIAYCRALSNIGMWLSAMDGVKELKEDVWNEEE